MASQEHLLLLTPTPTPILKLLLVTLPVWTSKFLTNKPS